MLRRVARIVRVLLFGAGMLLLIWMPLSVRYALSITSRWPVECVLFTGGGRGGVAIINSDLATVTPELRFSTHESAWALRPRISTSEGELWTHYLSIPLWMLVAAWPVTSFLVRRRRRGRG